MSRHLTFAGEARASPPGNDDPRMLAGDAGIREQVTTNNPNCAAAAAAARAADATNTKTRACTPQLFGAQADEARVRAQVELQDRFIEGGTP